MLQQLNEINETNDSWGLHLLLFNDLVYSLVVPNNWTYNWIFLHFLTPPDTIVFYLAVKHLLIFYP